MTTTASEIPGWPGFLAARATRSVLRAGPGLIAAVLLLGLVTVAALWPGLLARYDPDVIDLAASLDGPNAAHWFGTDQLGRDVFARVVHGARHSLLLGISATALGAVGGAMVGLAAGLGGRLLDGLLMRVADILLAFPELLLALVVISVMGPGPVNAAVAIGVAAIPTYARVVRSSALVVRRAPYLDAAVALGQSRAHILFRHVVPNTLGPLLVLATAGVGTATIAGSALSFLGLGTRPPVPEWGAMLSEGRNFVESAWWIVVFPGAAIAATVVSVTVVGRAARLRVEGRPR
ncbi:ABC transporter permease [Parafrankia sp. EUN1f]|uniref:ABC transporter permease n=1 Tax=Parafrankia sp. EUN1f TaxID=102897 RepID=UPI0001C44ADA|nr:ABC transporter permease [Parafrankia sp. EUN1f]EFC83403.1 binding-protein-dependent transport systems inner membrane component [Parafrankia sp. EUN1f]